MVALTDAAVQAEIVAEVGDVGGVLAATVPVLWQINQVYRAVPLLQYLTTKRGAVQAALTALRATGVRKTVGPLTEDNSVQVTALERLGADLDAQITQRIRQYAAIRPPVVGTITTVSPTVPPPYQLPNPFGNSVDANSVQYLGSPYTRIPPRSM